MNFTNKTLYEASTQALLVDDKPDHVRTSFWASDGYKDRFDLYHSWIGTKSTNPFGAETKLIFSAGKAIELAFVQSMINAGHFKDFNDDQMRVDMERKGVRITGYVDAVTKDGHPCEIKSYYGRHNEKDIDKGIAKDGYLLQLCVYMDFMDQDTGFLIYLGRDMGNYYVFEVRRMKDGRFLCIGTKDARSEQIIDLHAEYSRWYEIKTNYVDKKIEPVADYQYKYDIEETDWTKVVKSKRTDARTGKAVLGDWQAKYSSYKKLLVEAEAKRKNIDSDVYLGYTEKELARIAELTKGHSTWK